MKKNNYKSLAIKSANIQINELKKIKKVFDHSFNRAVDQILNCKGKVIFAGIGKSGLIARKISATFSSVGIPSFFCDPVQALHGDMGQIEKKDIFRIREILELSNMLYHANRYRIKLLELLQRRIVYYLKRYKVNSAKSEADYWDGSNIGNCLATTVMHRKTFLKKFKVFHLVEILATHFYWREILCLLVRNASNQS